MWRGAHGRKKFAIDGAMDGDDDADGIEHKDVDDDTAVTAM